jgi:hypothetical protein
MKKNGLIITDGRLHRWFRNDFLHRDEIDPKTGLSLPAIIFADGQKGWFINGRLYREDGPAIEYPDGKTRYYINNAYIPQLDNKLIYGKDNLAKFLVLI